EAKREILEKVMGEKTYKNIFDKLRRDIHLRKKIIFFTVVIGTLTWLFWGLPLPTNIGVHDPVSTKLFDRNGKLIYEIYTDKRRTPIKLSDLPDSVKQATIAIEDKDFYKHSAFSP